MTLRTLVFCTAYSQGHGAWANRYRPWLEYVRALGLADFILMVDDGSASLPGWPDLSLSSGDAVEDAMPPDRAGDALLHHFRHRLGRTSIYDFPGWHRSFIFAVRYARLHGFTRVMHFESDAYLLSPRIQAFFRDYDDGWAALWSARYLFPEITLQVAAGSGLERLWAFAERPYACMIGAVHENLLPFTDIELGFEGDRFGEDWERIPGSLDFVCQVPGLLEPGYYWWRRPGVAGPATASFAPEGRIDLTFNRGGNAVALLGAGWGNPEPAWIWMVAFISQLQLPPLPARHGYILRAWLWPNPGAEERGGQRLMLLLNDHLLAAFEIFSSTSIGAEIAPHMLRKDGGDLLRLVHPDAIAPHALRPEHPDRRRLSFAVTRLSLIPMPA